MTAFSAGSFPDLVRTPEGEVRGSVVVLAGTQEATRDFTLLVDQLVLSGFRVSVFDDVSLEPSASRVGVLQTVRSESTHRPLVLIGSDSGATLAANIVVDARAEVGALVLANLVTGAPAGGRPTPGARSPRAQDILVPSLVFHGDADEVSDVSEVVAWASELPFGAIRLVPRSGHTVLSGSECRAVAASIVLFLERQRAGHAVLVDGFASHQGRDV